MTSVEVRRALERYQRTLADAGVPEHLRDALVGHVVYGHQTGGFLYQCLADNMCGAVCRAGPDIDMAGLKAIAKWLFNDAPAESWGSDEAVNRWKERGGEAGR